MPRDLPSDEAVEALINRLSATLQRPVAIARSRLNLPDSCGTSVRRRAAVGAAPYRYGKVEVM